MEKQGEGEQDVERLKRLGKEANQEQGSRYSLWEKLAKKMLGNDEQKQTLKDPQV